MHPKYKTGYCVSSWPEYERGLIQCCDVIVWLTPEAIAALSPVPNGRRGGQRRFSDIAIEAAHTLRLVLHVPLRQTEGLLNSLLRLMHVDLVAPAHTTLSRRSQGLDVALRHVPLGAPIHLVVDSTGLSIVGEGEWAAVKHGSPATC